jgi:parvulin-like peptidyl-prolyl isomerase
VQVADRSLRLLLLLIGSGVLITVGFLFGLHQHFTVGAVGQAEVELRSQRDRLRSEQLYLELVRDQMLSLKELERQARQSKTIGPVKLDSPIASERERRKVR